MSDWRIVASRDAGPWVLLHGGTDEFREAFHNEMNAIAQTLMRSDSWRDWWSASGNGRLEIYYLVDHDVSNACGRPRVRKYQTRVTVTVHCDARGVDWSSPEVARGTARSLVSQALKEVRERFALGVPPDEGGLCE